MQCNHFDVADHGQSLGQVGPRGLEPGVGQDQPFGGLVADEFDFDDAAAAALAFFDVCLDCDGINYVFRTRLNAPAPFFVSVIGVYGHVEKFGKAPPLKN